MIIQRKNISDLQKYFFEILLQLSSIYGNLSLSVVFKKPL